MPAATPVAADQRADARAEALRATALAKAAAFTEWVTTWRRSDDAGQPALAAAGRDLARERGAALRELIPVDPRLALELAVPVGLRSELPGNVQAELEQRIDRRGDLEVTIGCFGAVTELNRTVLLGDQVLATYVYGRREHQHTKLGLPLHGIAIDGVFALAELPYRLLDDTEKAARNIAADVIAVAVGDGIRTLAGAAELEQLSQELVAAEAAPGPHLAKLGAPELAGYDVPPTAATTPWILGAKRVLWVKVDFADDTGAAATDEQIEVTNARVREFYAANSQGKTTMSFTILPAVLRLPRDKSVYNASSSSASQLQSDAATLAKAYDAAQGNTGTYNPDRYDRWIVLFKRVPAYTFGGQAQLSGPQVRMNGTISPGTTAHELGHTQGLAHAHYWLPAGTSAVGAGAHVEYGDVFDNMGSSGSSPNNHFNAPQKFKLGYLDDSSTTTVTESGTHRIARHDHLDATGTRGLKIARPDFEYDYWLEYRQFGPTAFNAAQTDRLHNGVLLHWGASRTPRFTTGAGSYLVDATPGSAGGATDAPLRIGDSFVDPDAGVTIRPLSTGGAGPNEYIDVQIGLGAVDGNNNPVLAADLPPAPLLPRTNIIFTARASDPDGDPVYFRWDFGDRQLNPNLDNVTRRFTKGGTYTLRVSAHDGRGGIAMKSLNFELVDPLIAWTARSSDVTVALTDVIYAGGRFVACGAGLMLRSPDGVAWARSSGTALAPFAWQGLAHSGSRYVVVGYRSTGTDRGGAAWSEDGTSWSVATIPSGNSQVTDVAFGAGHFVAVGEGGRIYSSPDGANWRGETSPVTTYLRAVRYANGLFVATGDSGRLLTSTDGVTWANRSVATGNQLAALAHHNGVWYASSATAECFSSFDGERWTRIATSGRRNSTTRMISIGELLLATTANGSIAFAEDPRTWEIHQLDATASVSFLGAAAGAGTVVAVGSRGLIYTTALPPSTSARIAAPMLRNEADSLKVAVGKTNVLAASGTGFAKLELYANGAKVSELTGSAGALEWTPRTIGNYSLVLRGVDSSGASVISSAVPAIAALPRWRWANPVPTGADLTGAVRVGSTWWVVGRAGTFFTVDSGGNTAPVDFPTTQHLTSIAHANGRFIVTGPYLDAGSKEEIGSIWTSADGYSWTPLLTTVFDNFTANFASYGGGQWLVGTSNGLLLTSPDGLGWTRQVSGVTTSLRRGVFAQNHWVVVGNGGRILTSSDGVAWTLRTSGVNTDLLGVAYENGAYIAVGNLGVILRSADGIDWVRVPSDVTSNLVNIVASNGAFTAVGTLGVVITSPDGQGWTRVPLDGTANDLSAVALAGSEGIIVGRAGEIHLSSPGDAWRRVMQGTAETKYAVIHAGGRFVSVGSTSDPVTRQNVVPIASSTDGIRWTRAAALPGFNSVNDVTYGQDLYVAVADAGRVFTSNDATSWIQRNAATTQQLHAATWGGGLFLAAGGAGTITTSPDTVSWTAQNSRTSNPLRAATFGDGRFVVVGDTGTIVTSTDGITWNTATSGTIQPLFAVGWWEQFGFIAAGNNGTMLRSSDGLNWTQIETGVSDHLTALARTPIGLVAAGGTNGTLIVSLDGSSWSVATLPSNHVVRGIAASANAIVAVGDLGSTLAFEFVDTVPPPAIVAQPVSQTTAPGASVTLTVSAQNTYGAVFQWTKDGQPIPGANTPTYTIPSVTAARTGSYAVAITSPTGRVTSAPAVIAVGTPSDPGRLINLSVRTELESATDGFTFGVVVGGSGTAGAKPLLVRAVGPSLAAFGLDGTLGDPKLELFTGTTLVGENDNWGGADALRTTISAVGAFPFSNVNSLDAAIFAPALASGPNSVRISGRGSGTVLAELYDATPAGSFTAVTPRLINVSVLKHIGTGVTAGFVIGGSTPRSVLVRAIGPTLGQSPFNVAGVVADPRLTLFRGSTQIGVNDNWAGTPALSSAFTRVGAFALPPDSRDAALMVELQPGNYTVQVTSVGGTGVALIEVYEIP